MAANHSPMRARCFHLAAVVAIGLIASWVQLKVQSLKVLITW